MPDLSIAVAAKHLYTLGITDALATASQAALQISVGVGQSNTAQIPLAVHLRQSSNSSEGRCGAIDARASPISVKYLR